MAKFHNPAIILYKKTLVGQRAYKRSIPRFCAISTEGICVKWNSPVTISEFKVEAVRKLREYLEGGTIWDVCVLYKHNKNLHNRARVFFRVKFPSNYKEYYDSFKESRMQVLKNISAITSKLRPMYSRGEFRNTNDFLTQFESTVKELFGEPDCELDEIKVYVN